MHWLYRRRRLVAALAWIALALAVLVAGLLLVGLLSGWTGLAVLAAAFVVLGLVGARLGRYVPRRAILEVDFERGVVERHPDDPPARMAGRRALVLRDVVDGLVRAAGDRRVAAVLARVGPSGIALAQAQEIRDAVKAFRASGKRAVAFCETLGEGRSAAADTVLAAAFDEVWLQPTGDVGFHGVLLRLPFLRGLLDTLGVRPQLDHRREYKDAKYLFTETEMPGPQRESLTSILGSRTEQVVRSIAGDRGLDEERVRALMDDGPFLGAEAKEAGLVDGLAYRDEVVERLRKETGGKLFYLDRYVKRAGRPHRRGPTVALVYGVGGVDRGRNGFRYAPPGPTMGSDDVTTALRRAAESKRVKAIVFRVDSPGGSAVASDAIWREVARARDEGKPVVVSMGNVAGSGGYFVAAAADRIVAQPATLTGSIGVVWGKFVTRDAWAKAGIRWEELGEGANAAFWSSGTEFDERGEARLGAFLDGIYDDFKSKVAEGRGLSAEAVEEVAKGRVWTGAQAVENGLVDETGGLHRAIEIAKERAGVPEEKGVRVKEFVARHPVAELLDPPDSSDPSAELRQALTAAAPLLRSLAPRGALSMDPAIAGGA